MVAQCKHLARIAKADGEATWKRFDFPTCIEEQKVMKRAFGSHFQGYQRCITKLTTWNDKFRCDSMSVQSSKGE